jgi:hypothetical protein
MQATRRRWSIALTHSWPRLCMGEIGQRHAPAAFYPGERTTRYPLDRRLGPQSWSDTEARGNILCRGSNPCRPVVQSVFIHYRPIYSMQVKLNSSINLGPRCAIWRSTSKNEYNSHLPGAHQACRKKIRGKAAWSIPHVLHYCLLIEIVLYHFCLREFYDVWCKLYVCMYLYMYVYVYVCVCVCMM